VTRDSNHNHSVLCLARAYRPSVRTALGGDERAVWFA